MFPPSLRPLQLYREAPRLVDRDSIVDQDSDSLKPNEIVLLEEPDRYRHNGSGPGTRAAQPAEAALPLSAMKPFAGANSVRTHARRLSACGDPYAMRCTPTSQTAISRTASDTIPAYFGALRDGGPVSLFTRDHVGLLLNWTLVGFLQAALGSLTYPLFGVFLNYSASQMNAAYTLMGSGWYFKFALGFITDTYAINRQRRKPYMFLGFAVVGVIMLGMAAMHKIASYGGPRVNGKVLVQNADAPNQGIRYVVPLIVVSFARLLATVACEGMMIEFSHREGEFDRGRAQLWCLAFRFLGEFFGNMFTALSISSKEYGGRFDHALPLGVYFAVLGLVASVGVAVTYYYVKEEPVPNTRQSFGSNLRRVWRFMERRVTTQVMVALFMLSSGMNTDVMEYSSIYTAWFHTDSLVRSLVAIFQSTGYIVAAAAFYLRFLNTNWRTMVISGLGIAFVLRFPLEMLCVWDVLRSGALFLTKDWVSGIFEAVPWIVRVMVTVETAEPGLESTTYGILTTLCNLNGVMVSSVYNFVSISWDAKETTLADDTDLVRWHLTNEFIAKYALRFGFAIVAIAVLPRQKRHLKEIKICGDPNLAIPIVLFLLVGVLFAACIASAVLSMFESTMCLPFAGGSGCH